MEPWQDALVFFGLFSLLGLLILLIVHRRRPQFPLRVRLQYHYAPMVAFFGAFAAVPLVVQETRLRIPFQLALFFAWYAITRSKPFRERTISAALQAESQARK